MSRWKRIEFFFHAGEGAPRVVRNAIGYYVGGLFPAYTCKLFLLVFIGAGIDATCAIFRDQLHGPFLKYDGNTAVAAAGRNDIRTLLSKGNGKDLETYENVIDPYSHDLYHRRVHE